MSHWLTTPGEGAIGWQLGKECLWRFGWYSTIVITTVHLLHYSDPHASYKNLPHQGKAFPRFLFVSLPGELKRSC